MRLAMPSGICSGSKRGFSNSDFIARKSELWVIGGVNDLP
jgi:hypothetical protein